MGASEHASEENTSTEEHSPAESSIFRTPVSALDVETLSIIIICLIVFTIMVEFTLHKVDSIARRHKQYFLVLKSIYKELMILGFVSFLTVLINESVVLPPEQFHLFEFVHILVFLVALFYIAHAVVWILNFRWLKRKWDRVQNKPLSEIISAVNKAKKWKFWYYPSTGFQEAEFQVLRYWFLRVHHLPKNFDFSKYLRKSLTRQMVKLLDIHYASWFLLAIGFTINIGWHRILKGKDDKELYTFLAFGWTLSFVYWIVLWYTRSLKNRLLKKAGVADVYKIDDFLNDVDKRGQRRAARINTIRNIGTIKRENEGDAQHIFFLNRPYLIRHVIELLLLAQCYYLGIFVMMDARAALSPVYNISTAKAVVIILAYITPALMNIVYICPQVMRNYSYCYAIAKVNKKVFETVLERMEEAEIMKTALLSSFKRAFSFRCPRNFAMKIFQELDKDGNKSISFNELRFGLKKLGIEYSKQKLKRLFRILDPGEMKDKNKQISDQSGQISYDEFVDQLFTGEEAKFAATTKDDDEADDDIEKNNEKSSDTEDSVSESEKSAQIEMQDLESKGITSNTFSNE